MRGPFISRGMKFASLILALLLTGCAVRSANTAMNDSVKPDSLKPISEVLADHTSAWMNIRGVTGTGEGKKDGKPAILIFVDSLTDDLRSKLPSQSEGYPVVVGQTGEIKANTK
jgi:hypothetical protein